MLQIRFRYPRLMDLGNDKLGRSMNNPRLHRANSFRRARKESAGIAWIKKPIGRRCYWSSCQVCFLRFLNDPYLIQTVHDYAADHSFRYLVPVHGCVIFRKFKLGMIKEPFVDGHYFQSIDMPFFRARRFHSPPSTLGPLTPSNPRILGPLDPRPLHQVRTARADDPIRLRYSKSEMGDWRTICAV